MASSFTCTNLATLFLISLYLFSPLVPCHGESEAIHKLVINVCKQTQYEDMCFDTFKQCEMAEGVTNINSLARVAIASIMKRTSREETLQFKKFFGTSKAEIFHTRYGRINKDLRMAFETLEKEGCKREEVIRYLGSALFNVEECQKGFNIDGMIADDKFIVTLGKTIGSQVDMEKKMASAENMEIMALCNNAISICQNLPGDNPEDSPISGPVCVF